MIFESKEWLHGKSSKVVLQYEACGIFRCAYSVAQLRDILGRGGAGQGNVIVWLTTVATITLTSIQRYLEKHD